MSFVPAAVAAKREASDYKQAIEIVGSLYQQQGIASSDYTEAMIEAVSEFGPYMVLMPGLAMPHAKSGRGVKKQGAVVVTLSTPVTFGHPKNDPVDTLVSFAAAENKGHMEMIQSLAEALGDAGLLEKIRAAETDEQLRAVFDQAADN